MLKALPAGITDTIVVVAMVIFGNIFNSEESDIATASTILLCIVGLMILFMISKPMNSIKWGIWIFCAVGLAVCMLFVSNFFGISAMSLKCALLCVNFSIIADPVLRYLTIFINHIKKILAKEEETV